MCCLRRGNQQINWPRRISHSTDKGKVEKAGSRPSPPCVGVADPLSLDPEATVPAGLGTHSGLHCELALVEITKFDWPSLKRLHRSPHQEIGVGPLPERPRRDSPSHPAASHARFFRSLGAMPPQWPFVGEAEQPSAFRTAPSWRNLANHISAVHA